MIAVNLNECIAKNLEISTLKCRNINCCSSIADVISGFCEIATHECNTPHKNELDWTPTLIIDLTQKMTGSINIDVDVIRTR